MAVDRGTATRWTNSLRAFVRTVERASFSDLRALQDPPHGSLAWGAAGLVSVLLHHGTLVQSPHEVSIADRWLREIASSRARSLFYAEPYASKNSRSSLWFGVTGIHCLRVLSAVARREPAYVRRATASLVRHVVSDEAACDFVNGAAGHLVAVSLLGSVARSAALHDVASQLRERVVRSLPALQASWSFAHGWPGLAFALLQDARASGRALPAQLPALLRGRAEIAPATADVAPWVRYSWCNGAAGRVLLWVSAFEFLGDDVFLERARAEAGTIPDWSDEVAPGLCCGALGWAYAFLALGRVDRDGGWDGRAWDIAIQIARADPAFSHASSLMSGNSGVLYLATELLLNSADRGFPFVETLPSIGRV